jgi:uncharacterized protein (TIGR03086 family)
MNIIDLGSAADRLGVLIAAVPDQDLGRPTPCRAYSVGDLLDHIAGLTVAFQGAATKAGGLTATMGPAGDASNLPVDWRAVLPQRVKELAQAWADPQAWDGMTQVGGRDLPGDVAGTVAFGELSIHGWDLSRATSIPFEPDPAGVMPLFDLVSYTFGGPDQEADQDAARGTAFGPPIPVPAGAPVFDRVLGLLGREPAWAAP